MPTMLFNGDYARQMAQRSLITRARKAATKATLRQLGIKPNPDQPDALQAILVERAPTELSERSNRVRLGLADILARSVDNLRMVPWKPGIEHTKAKGEAVKLLAGSAAQVFGWDAESGSPLILVGEMRNALDIKPSACGVDTPTDGVQPACGQLANTTSPQVPDCQQLTDKPTEQK